MKIEFEINPDENDVQSVYNGLDVFNKPVFGDVEIIEFACFIRVENNRILGGATGYIFDKVAMVKYLWIDENLRGQGRGVQIFDILESEFKQRNVEEIHLDTYSFQAPEFYRKLGFKEVARYMISKAKKIEKIFFIKEL